jgi:hypothetical protein
MYRRHSWSGTRAPKAPMQSKRKSTSDLKKPTSAQKIAHDSKPAAQTPRILRPAKKENLNSNLFTTEPSYSSSPLTRLTHPAKRHISHQSHASSHIHKPNVFSRATLRAIRDTTTHLKVEAEKSQTAAGYQVDHWEMTTLGEVLHETGGKLLCTLPAGERTSWVTHELADISTALNHNFSHLTPQLVAEIEERYKKKQHPKGISQYFAGPDSFRHGRIHPAITGEKHQTSYVEFTQIAAGKRPHKPWLWMYHIPQWMADIPVASGYAKANKTRILVDDKGMPLINPETSEPIIQTIGVGNGRQIYVSPITIALIHRCARRVLIQDETMQHFDVAKVHWHHGKVQLEHSKPLEPISPIQYHVTPGGEVFATVNEQSHLRHIPEPKNRMNVMWQSMLLTAVIGNKYFDKFAKSSLPASVGLGVMHTFASNQHRAFHTAISKLYKSSEQPSASKALTLFSPRYSALMVLPPGDSANTKTEHVAKPHKESHDSEKHMHKRLR